MEGRIAVIGAGPIGCYVGGLLAKAGIDVGIFEDHRKIGVPVQCTGIVTGSINKILDIEKLDKKCVLNRINTIRIIAPDNNYVEFRLKEENLILDRTRFDSALAKLAEKNGAKIFLRNKFMDYEKDKGMVTVMDSSKKKNQLKRIEVKGVIGADGPMSSVAKSSGLYGKRKFMYGVQARIKMKNDNCVSVFLGTGDFAWVVPETKNIVRVGLMSENKTGVLFKDFLNRVRDHFKIDEIKENDIIEYQGGMIPLYNKAQKILSGDVFLVGDSGLMVKATTGGGLVPGIKAAKILVDCIVNGNKEEYLSRVKKEVGKELRMHLFVRKVLHKFKDKDWNKLVLLCGKQKNKEIIEGIDRDNLKIIMPRLLFSEPRLLGFLLKLL